MPQTIGILGKKVGMTRVYDQDGRAVPVTVIEAGPCVVVQRKTQDKEGYNAIQVGFEPKKEKHANKCERGHVAASGGTCYRHLTEFRVADPSQYEVGQTVALAEIMAIGSLVTVSGFSKGRGFQGVVKRHGFKGGPGGHGSMFHRAPGSIGCSAWPSKVIKGKKLPGRMGNQKVSKKNVLVVDVRPERNLLVVKGAVPGAQNGLLKIYARS